jgi:uncharacterized protein YegJ (DUF2314 family)
MRPSLILLALLATDSIIRVPKDDPAMAEAIATARHSLPQLLHLITAPPSGLRYLSVKTPLTDGVNVEHVWLTDVALRAGRFVGKIGNDLETVRGWAIGDSVTILPDSLSDWMATVDGRMLGGFSVRVLRARMSAPERAQFDKETNGAFSTDARLE